MKTQVNYQTRGIKYITVVLAVSLFLIVFFSQFKSYKEDYHNISFLSSTSSEITPISLTSEAKVTSESVEVEVLTQKAKAETNNSTGISIIESTETEIELKDWMVEASAWNDGLEPEIELVITDWMVSNDPWIISDGNIEGLLVLEDWMLDTALWNLIEDSYFVEERDDIVYIQDWMVSEDSWFEALKTEQDIIQEERLMSINSIL